MVALKRKAALRKDLSLIIQDPRIVKMSRVLGKRAPLCRAKSKIFQFFELFLAFMDVRFASFCEVQ